MTLTTYQVKTDVDDDDDDDDVDDDNDDVYNLSRQDCGGERP